MASHYQKTLAPVSTGGLSYAQGNARIAAQPDAAGDATTPTITAQIDRFLASQTFAPNDIVLLNGGISDLIVGMAAVRAGTLSAADYVAQARQNGKDMAARWGPLHRRRNRRDSACSRSPRGPPWRT